MQRKEFWLAFKYLTFYCCSTKKYILEKIPVMKKIDYENPKLRKTCLDLGYSLLIQP